MKKIKYSDIEEFIALPDWKKNQIIAEIEAESPTHRLANSRPLNARERAQWEAFKKSAAKRPADDHCTKKVSIDVEQSLLEQADAYAKRHKLNRSELFSRSLKKLIETT